MGLEVDVVAEDGQGKRVAGADAWGNVLDQRGTGLAAVGAPELNAMRAVVCLEVEVVAEDGEI